MPLPLCVRVEDDNSVKALEADGWYQIEILHVYRGVMPNIPNEFVRIARNEDFKACEDIVSQSFENDRLHRDPRVSDEEANRFKIDCLERCFENDEVRVYDRRGVRAVAARSPVWRLNMIAVHPVLVGWGVGSALMNSFAGIMIAGTQSDNFPAIRLYRSLGMEHIQSLRTYHKCP